jgi:hypothetical protein
MRLTLADVVVMHRLNKLNNAGAKKMAASACMATV